MTEHILQFFDYAHLPVSLQVVSIPFYELATKIVDGLPRNPERTVALRKLLEAKDAAVRAKIATSESVTDEDQRGTMRTLTPREVTQRRWEDNP